MTGKARVRAALTRQAVDRTPMWLWYHAEIYTRLRERFGWDAEEADARLGNDIKQVHISINREMFRPLPPGEPFVDAWGVTWVKEGWYNQVCCNPLADADVSALVGYRFPDPDEPGRYDALDRLCDRYGDEFYIGADVSGSIFEPCYHIRGMDRLLCDMLDALEAVETFFDHAAAFTTAVCLRALERPVDWIWLGDDVGGQEAMMLSPGLWRDLLKPRLAGVIAAVKAAKPGIAVAYHSCGAIAPIIPDLIEIGVDVLNPVQPECMDFAALHAEYGSRLSFTGTIGTQTTMPFGTPADVRATVWRNLETAGSKGGLLAAPTHVLEPEVPWENVLAYFEACRDFRP